jgi:MYXO-CTERM domain-containing protein
VRALFLLLFLLGWESNALAVDDPFTPYLNSVPTVAQSLSQTNSGAGASAITTRELTLSSRGGANTIFGIEVFPQQAGVYPGLLLLHGGGSHAEDLRGMAVEYAQRGYVALAVDLPGICGTGNTPNSSGPWKTRPGGEGPRFDIASGPQNSTLVDAEVAGLEAFNWLRSQTNVDPNAMGVTGFSWGGYSTTMLSGLVGNKIKAAYAVFGCGFYEKGSFWKDIIAAMPEVDRNVWLMYLDAGRRAPQIKGAYFLEAETNDTFFWPEAAGATIEAAGGAKNHVWGPNLNHNQLPAGPAMQRLFFDYHLKGVGSPFATVWVSRIEPQTDGRKKVTANVNLPSGVTVRSAQLYYSEQSSDWQHRVWSPIDAPPEAGAYSAMISKDLADKQINFYVLVTDSRMAATASAMFDSSSVVLPADGGAEGGDASSVEVAPPDATASNPPVTSGPIADAGANAVMGEAGSTNESSAPGASPAGADNGCACRTTPVRSAPHNAFALLLAAGALVARRRRRSRLGWSH